MKLGHKLLLSYLAVVLVGVAVLAVSLAVIAPASFSQHMQMMDGGIMISGGQGMMRGYMGGMASDLQRGFRQALNTALVLGGLAAVAAAGGVSWAVSRMIAAPLREMASVSHRIADGRYSERVSHASRDEVGELAESFNRMALALEETETMRQQLIADVSHELKTPLASIKGYMEGLQDGVIPATPETFDLVHREAARLERLVRDLQELSRAEAAQLRIELIRQDAVEPARSAVEFLRPQFEGKSVALELHAPEIHLDALLDFDRVRQVIVNLLGNALRYTPAGGMVTVTVEPSGAAVCYSVRDTGSGLDAADLERVFQRFYRVDKSRSRAGGGSGIGLTIARYIVEAQGGHIRAESAGPGKGATFSFTLPRAD